MRLTDIFIPSSGLGLPTHQSTPASEKGIFFRSPYYSRIDSRVGMPSLRPMIHPRVTVVTVITILPWWDDNVVCLEPAITSMGHNGTRRWVKAKEGCSGCTVEP